MKLRDTLAAAFLAIGFVVISVILLLVEPGMGFSSFADYFDPAKVARAATSRAWLAGDLVYLGFGVALSLLALSTADPVRKGSGAVAAVLFFLLGCCGRILAVLPAHAPDPAQLHAFVSGLLPVRLAVLRVTVFALAVFAWRTTVEPGAGVAWRGFGYVLLLAGATFVFVFIPVPLLFVVWAAMFAVRTARHA